MAEAILQKLPVDDYLKNAEPTLLITSDQVVVYEGVIREKPTSKEEARQFLKDYSGRRVAIVGSVLVTNLKTGLGKGDWNRVEVSINPEVSSKAVNRSIIAELVRLYKESDLGMRLPAYDGRKSLYTAGALPFSLREFKIKIMDDEDGFNGPKRERGYRVVIKFVARANLHHLGQFLAGKHAHKWIRNLTKYIRVQGKKCL